MSFTIPTSLNITGIVSTISKSVNLVEENVHQVNLTIPPSTTDEEIFLDITDLSRVKSLYITVSSPITYNFSIASGENFSLNSAVMLLGGSAQAFQKLVSYTAGTIVEGQQYFIDDYQSGDSFTGVGASANNTNISFIATSGSYTWSNGSTLTTSTKELTSIFVTNSSTATTVTFNAVVVISNN